MKHITTKEFSVLRPIDRFHKENAPDVGLDSTYQNIHTVFAGIYEHTAEQSAWARITADDYYKLYINGSFVCMGPAPAYPSRQNYNEVNVSQFLHIGENHIAVHVYYQGLVNRAYNSGDNLCSMAFELFDSNGILFQADEHWTYQYDRHYISGGTVGHKTLFLENLDFTMYDSAMYHGETIGEAAVEIPSPYTMAKFPVACVELEKIMPSITKVLSDDEIFFDFGREYVGYPSFDLQGKRGQVVTLLLGEETEADNPFRPRWELRCKCDYKETLTLSGGTDRADFFDYKAFRYMTLEGKDIAHALDLFSVCLLARHAPYQNGGAALVAAESLVKDIWSLCEHTAHYATQEGFLDCPTREKGQYLGDFTVSGLAQLYLTGDPAMYKKTLYDFAESRKICSGLMAVAPGSFMQEIADFSLQYPLQVYNYLRYTGDRETAEELFPVILGMLHHFERFIRNDGLLVGVIDKWNLVDWPQNLRDDYDHPLPHWAEPDSFHNVINAFYIGAHLYTERLAKLLQIEYSPKSAPLICAYQTAFYDEEQRLYRDTPTSRHASLHSNALPAFFGFAKQEARAPIAEMIRQKGLCCGVQFSYFVLGACARLGEYALEYALLTGRGEHSWYNMLKEGATMLFEAWGKEQKWNTSLCHPWASAPIIALCDDAAGFRACGIDLRIQGHTPVLQDES